MSHQGEHFPTFSKAYRVATTPARSRTVHSLVRLERTLLRLALYVFLVASGLGYLAGRLLMYIRGNRGMSPLSLYNPGPYGWSGPPGVWTLDSLFYVLSIVVFPHEALLVVVLCLVGLAASAQRPIPEASELGPIPPPPEPLQAPPEPQRHPLDPSPDDPPLVDYPWVHPRSKRADRSAADRPSDPAP
jgi:hypothetical protein